MLRRLLLALLIACLAAPAMAAPGVHLPVHRHTAPSAAMHAHHQAPPATPREDAACGTAHECIGCLARYDGVAPLATPGLTPVSPLQPRASVQLVGARYGPETPPPRC